MASVSPPGSADQPRPAAPGAPSATTSPSGDPEAAAFAAFGRAVAASPGYADWLGANGVDPSSVTSIDDVPYLTKRDVFGSDLDRWIEGGATAEAAELLTSSGQSGAFSVGVTSRAELLALQAATDAALRAAGAGEDSSTLLLNCLSMGISVPTTLATVATPSVHLEMAQELYERLAPDFDRVVILSEPIFLKELAERLFAGHGSSWRATETACIVGGEWISESWRRYVSGLLGMAAPHEQGDTGIMISMGAAELGMNLLFETPGLRSIRSLLDESGQARELFRKDWGYTPTLFVYDPSRLYIEEREHEDGTTTLGFTPLTRRLLPLVRYDLGDLAEIVPPDRINEQLAALGAPAQLPFPVIAFWGRQSAGVRIGGRVVRPELIKQRLFSYSAEAAVLTGRFYLEQTPNPVLHVQLRPDTVATPRLAADLGAFLGEATGRTSRVALHSHADYPYHLAGDFQHKPTYHALA
jgi:phenylacetate-coenzyme A ligase PaaK-like adenylate-forming protein